MSITSYCSECKAVMMDGVLKHHSSCSANKFKMKPSTDYFRPPSIVLKFDSKAEQDEWLNKLKGSSVIFDSPTNNLSGKLEKDKS